MAEYTKSGKDFTGLKFGKLTVIEFSHKYIRNTIWRCICDCGNETLSQGTHLNTGRAKSCGCIAREKASKRFKTHGLSRTRTYGIWNSMMGRCYRIKRNGYERYGGRGITVCDRWHDYLMFLEDMGEAPHLMEIDRINNDGNYEPSNCRWATRKEQARNTSSNRLITYNGKTACIAEWVEITGLKFDCIKYRLNSGWSPEEILGTK